MRNALFVTSGLFALLGIAIVAGTLRAMLGAEPPPFVGLYLGLGVLLVAAGWQSWQKAKRSGKGEGR